MKWPLSFKEDAFWIAFVASAAIHGGVLFATGMMPERPQFRVEQGRDSIEIVIIEETPKPKVVQKVKKKVIAAVKPAPQTPEVFQPPETPKLKKPELLKREIVKPPKFVREVKEIEKKPVVTKAETGAIVKKAYPTKALKNPAPKYPLVARRRGWEGVVKLKVLVRKDGVPDQVIVEQSSGYTILDETAKEAVESWSFIAARRGHLKFKSWIVVPIQFKIQKR